jgi:hypothetical protein
MTKHGEFGMYVMAIAFLSKKLHYFQCVGKGLRLQPVVIMTIRAAKNQGFFLSSQSGKLP